MLGQVEVREVLEGVPHGAVARLAHRQPLQRQRVQPRQRPDCVGERVRFRFRPLLKAT
jgi:hypothetical protein